MAGLFDVILDVANRKGKNVLQGAQAAKISEELPYLGEYYRSRNEDLAAGIPLKQAQTRHFDAETSLTPAKMAQLQALAGLQNAEAMFMPREVAVKEMNARTSAGELGLNQQRYSPDRLKLSDEDTRSKITDRKEKSNIRKFGSGAGGKEEMLFQSLIKKDNPHLTDDQIYEASNAIREGKNQLADGTVINPLSPAAKGSLDRLKKYGTTSALINANVKGAQAEAEIAELSKHAQAGLKPYATTYFNYNPKQILDSFKNDDASQERLGHFIAAKQLQYEIAQNQIKLAGGEPGVTSTQELMNLGMQGIHALYPKLSAKARESAQNYFIEGLAKGFKARHNVSIGASDAFSNSSSPTATLKYNPSTGKLEPIQ